MHPTVTTLAQAWSERLGSIEIWQIAGAVFVAMVLLQAALYVLLYRRPRIDEALVRNGLWDVRVAVNSGILVLPIVHKVKRVQLSEHSLEFPFEGPHALRWQGGERFEGTVIASVQVPPENATLVVQAARSFRSTEDAAEMTSVLQAVYRSTCRDVLRRMKRITFDLEPAAVEVRLTQALDMASTAFGLRLRAVHMYPRVDETGRMRRALVQLDGMADGDDGDPVSPAARTIEGKPKGDAPLEA